MDLIKGLENLKKDEIYEIYLALHKKIREDDELKQYINKMNIENFKNRIYYCTSCKKNYNLGYKYLHEKSKLHKRKIEQE